jgi:hypothetical protein
VCCTHSFFISTQIAELPDGKGNSENRAAEAPPRSFALGQWMAKLSVSDEDQAEKLGVRRESVWRWQTGER